MEILTERLRLSSYQTKDKSDFINLFTDEKVMKHVDEGVLLQTDAEKLWDKVFGNEFKLTKTPGRF